MVIARHDDESDFTGREGSSDDFEEEGDYLDNEVGEQDLEDNEASGGSVTGGEVTADDAWEDLGAPTPVDNEEELYRAQSYLDGLEKDLENVEKQIDDTEPGMLEKLAKVADQILFRGLVGSAAEAFNKLTQSGESALNDAEKNLLRAELKVEQQKLKNRIKATEDGIKEITARMTEQESSKVNDSVSKKIEDFQSKNGRYPNDLEVNEITKSSVVEAAPTSQVAQEIRRASQEELIKSYNPNANIQQFGMVDPKMLGEDSNAALEAGLEQLRQMEAKRAETQAIRDQSLKAADAWTKLTEGNRDAWKQYYDPSKYSATAQQAQASTANFREFDPASLVDRTTVNPAVLALGDYTVEGERLRDFDSTLQTSDQRAATTRALGMMEDRATGKAPSVAELSYLQNLDKLINTQQGAMASQRGASNPLAMRSIAQQSAQMGQQAIRETAALRAEEQRQAELNMAQQANTIVAEDQKRIATQKQMELENNIAYTNVLLQNAKNELDKDMFNADAQNKVSQLQASLDAQMKEFNANAMNVRNIENTRLDNQMRIENARNLTDVSKVNAQLGTDVSVQNAANALRGDTWAGDQAQTALMNQLAQERADTMARYGISRDALGTEMDILNQLANQELGLGSAQKGWDYQKQQAERQADMDWWTKLGTTVKAGGDLLGTLSEFL